MVFHEPSVEYVKLSTSEIIAATGAGYTICQRVYGSDVGCANFTSSNISASEMCAKAWCDTSSNAATSAAFNS